MTSGCIKWTMKFKAVLNLLERDSSFKMLTLQWKTNALTAVRKKFSLKLSTCTWFLTSMKIWAGTSEINLSTQLQLPIFTKSKTKLLRILFLTSTLYSKGLGSLWLNRSTPQWRETTLSAKVKKKWTITKLLNVFSISENVQLRNLNTDQACDLNSQ